MGEQRKHPEPFEPGIWEGCRWHKPRKMFDFQCNACIIRAVRLLSDKVNELEEKLNGST